MAVTEHEKAVVKRAKKLMRGLLLTQKISDGRQREEAWLRCRKLAEQLLTHK
jgi:hypothetical protein